MTKHVLAKAEISQVAVIPAEAGIQKRFHRKQLSRFIEKIHLKLVLERKTEFEMKKER